MAQDRDRVVDHYLLRQLNRGRTKEATFSYLPALFLVEAVLPALQPQEHSRSKPGIDRQAGAPQFEAIEHLQPGVPVHDRRILVQEGHRVIPVAIDLPPEEPFQRVQYCCLPFEQKSSDVLSTAQADTKGVRRPTDAGEHPLTDPYTQRGVHRNQFASPGTVD